MNRLYTQALDRSGRCEPTVFDSVMWQAACSPRVYGELRSNESGGLRHSYFTKSLTSAVSILIPGPIVVDTAIPFR